MTRLTALVGLVVAGWPVLRWYALRLRDGSDEPLGLVALAVACFFLRGRDWRAKLPRWLGLGLMSGILAYVVVYPWMPALARALVFVILIGVAVAPKISAFAWTVLLSLSLPLVSTLQFYFGYPLRLPTTQLAAMLLRCGGIAANADGTTLLWAGERVIIDAPCSGIQMAWTGAFFAAAIACWQRFPLQETLRLFRWTGVIVFVVNVVRTAALFLMGSGIWHLPSYAHEGIGLLLFVTAIVLIVSLACRFQTPCPV